MKLKALSIFSSIVLMACGGGGSSTNPEPGAPQPPEFTLLLNISATKVFEFTWENADSDTTHYRLLENADGASGFTQVGSDIASGVVSQTLTAPLYDRVNAQYILEACNPTECEESNTVSVGAQINAGIGLIKASNAGSGDFFGSKVTISADGSTLAVSATAEDSNGTEADNSLGSSGAVYVYQKNGSGWLQQAYLKAPTPASGEQFGFDHSMSNDGNTIVVGGIGLSEVYVFERTGSTWSLAHTLISSNAGFVPSDRFGFAVSISGDGNVIAVGNIGDSSNFAGLGATAAQQQNTSMSFAGAVQVFEKSGPSWSNTEYIKASNPDQTDQFGISVALNDDGSTLVVGASFESSSATGINGAQNNNNTTISGAVYVFDNSGSAWAQTAYIKASDNAANREFGRVLSVSADGDTFAVVTGSGSKAYIFERDLGTWSEQATFTPFFTASLSASGDTLALGYLAEASAAIGLDGDETNTSAPNAGAVSLLKKGASGWESVNYIKASNTASGDNFGTSIAISDDESALFVGARNQAGEGAAYLY